MISPEIKQVIEDRGVKLYDTEVVTDNSRKIFRIYITSDKGISLDKCSEITKIISPLLDIDPPLQGEYTLEISSPGIDRKLTKLEHFKNSINELAKIKLNSDEKLKCKIIKVTGKNITFFDKKSKEEREVLFDDIIKAKTYFEW